MARRTDTKRALRLIKRRKSVIIISSATANTATLRSLGLIYAAAHSVSDVAGLCEYEKILALKNSVCLICAYVTHTHTMCVRVRVGTDKHYNLSAVRVVRAARNAFAHLPQAEQPPGCCKRCQHCSYRQPFRLI